MSFFREAVRDPLVLLTAATIFLFVALWWWLPTPFNLTIPIRTSRAVQLKLYYAESDSGFREDKCSVRFADSRGAFKAIHLPIARTDLRALRLHVGPGAVVDFGQIILTPLGKSGITIPPSEISIVNNSCKMEQQDSVTRFKTAADSYGFDIDLRTSAVPVINGTDLEPILVTLLCCGLLGLLGVIAYRRRACLTTLNVPIRTKRISDKACGAVVLGLTLLVCINVLLNLNGSSSAVWRFCVDGRLPDRGLFLGTAKDIRSDEWMVQTPWMLSQASNEPPFQTSNPNVGDGATCLLVNLPIRHWTTFFRPQFWGFFVFNAERAFSWYWNLKWYVLVVGSFLFFRLITRGHFWATIAGTALVFFAPYMQWWYSTGAALPEIVGLALLSVWAFHFVRRAKTPLGIALGAVTLLVAIENFIYCCYPRFQIPLLYFALLGVIWISFTTRIRSVFRFLRYACLAAVLVLVALCAFVWFGEVASTLRMTAQLEYPGRVFSIGGDFSWAHFFVPFLQFGMSEFHFPPDLVNACNASGFVLLLPFLALLMASRAGAWRDGFILLMLGFVIAVGYFMMVGIPAALAKYSGWSLVYSTRGILPVGIASIACFVRALARPTSRQALNPIFALVLLLVLAVAWWFCLSSVNQNYQEFVSATTVIAVAAYLAVISILFIGRTARLATILLLTPIVVSTAFVNPLGHGLPGFYESETFRNLRAFAGKDHTGRWLVIGNGRRSGYLPYLIKATGGDALGGIRNNPDMRVFDVLDPGRKHFDVWNRFAVVTYTRSSDDQIALTLTSGVSYTVTLPFRTELLDRLGIKYILSVDTPQKENEIPGFHATALQEGLVVNVREQP